jgi:predicted PurR-regulated permease PerM
MADALRVPRPWFTFTGCVLAIAVLYWAQVILVPIAFAVLLAFVLAPVVTALQRWTGRVTAVSAVVTLSCAGLGLVGWLVTQQLASLAVDIPTYQRNIDQKIRDVRGLGEHGLIEKLRRASDKIGAELGVSVQADSDAAPPPVVNPDPGAGLHAARALLDKLAAFGLVVLLVVFMLLERERLRERVIRLFGHGRLVATTRAFDEASQRVSRYLLAQSLVNVLFGTCVGLGTFLIGLPYPLLWAALAGVARYVPYVGPGVAFLAPLLVSLALEGWMRPLLVVALFTVLELVTNLELETVVYAGVAGISKVALLIGIAFWAWLWGPLGILLATPLTVCLAVMGKHVPGLEFVSTLISDEPVLEPDISYYQRLLAGDQAEATEIAERYAGETAAEAIFDAIMLPALNYAERDRIEGRLTADEERSVIEATRELLADAPARINRHDAAGVTASAAVPVLGIPADGEGDAVALQMLADLLRDSPASLEMQPGNRLTSEIVEIVKREPERYRAVCIADLPPSSPARSRSLAKRLRAIAPELPILVGRWAPPSLADESDEALRAAGATHVSSTLVETRDRLAGLFPAAEPSEVPKPRKRLFRFGGGGGAEGRAS